MRKKLSKKEVESLSRLQDRIIKLQDRLYENDVPLNYGNGTAYEQMSVACAALETILQEY